jgi:nitrate reductase delta subunit
MDDKTLFDAVADLLVYPDATAEPSLRAAVHALFDAPGVLADAARRHARFLDVTPPTDLEERFTRTFDINPACTLEVGWQLFGEDYRRGAFLVAMRQTMRKAGVEETGELPDHLTHVLRVLGRLDDDERPTFATSFVTPALERMAARFKDRENPWRELLTGLLAVLVDRFGPAEEVPGGAGSAGLACAAAPYPVGTESSGCGPGSCEGRE